MKHQKLIASLFCIAVFFSAAACSSSYSKSGSSLSDESAPSLVSQEQSAASSLLASVSSEAINDLQAVSSGQSKNPESIIDGNLSTQETVLNQIDAALDTKVTLMLPASIPIEKNRHLTATTASQATEYKVNFYETDQVAKINSQAASKGRLIASLEGTKYKDDAGAKESISDYKQISAADYDEFADLGHNIRAAEQAGTGHQHLLWNEGRWYIDLDYPSDSTFQNKDYPDSKQLAKNIVSYLDKNMLPAPKKIGVIRIMNWNTSEGTTIQWQDNQTVYQIRSQNPMTALKVAVSMKFK